MATIKHRGGELPLYANGLVKMSDRLYETIVNIVEKEYINSLKKVSWRLFLSLIKVFKQNNPDNQLVYSVKSQQVPITLFVHTIMVDTTKAIVDVELSLPLLGKQSEHSEVLQLLLNRVSFPGARIEAGGLRLNIILGANQLPTEVKPVGSNGQKSFVLLSELPTVT